MARSKQATPLRREVSSEYTSKADRTPRKADKDTESTHKSIVTNGHANGKAAAGNAPYEQKQAGIPQLIIAVGGIYASLYYSYILSNQ
jgi:solute carrier family 35 (UDP-galactose transporter), member B1